MHEGGIEIRGKRRPQQSSKQQAQPKRNNSTRVSRTMSDTGSDYTEQTGMVSELTLEREVRRERPAAQAAGRVQVERGDEGEIAKVGRVLRRV